MSENANIGRVFNLTGEGGKADRSRNATGVLLSNAWVGTEAPYTQDLIVEGLTAKQNGDIYVSHNATPQQREAATNASMSVVGQSTGKLTIAADGDLPELDIPVTLTLLG